MRTRFFQYGSPECPLIAITDFEPSQVAMLLESISRLASGEPSAIELNGDVPLRFELGDRNIGILTQCDPHFSCRLNRTGWEQVAGLLEPFLEPNERGYQWRDTTGAVKLLISKNSAW